MSIEYRFIEPLDVLLLRGNKLFGDPGSYGECLMPPWPSVAAGALRSRMLVDDGVDLAAFGQGQVEHPTLGTPKKPGSFVLAGFHLARRSAGQAGGGSQPRSAPEGETPSSRVQILMPPPADLVITAGESSASSDAAPPLHGDAPRHDAAGTPGAQQSVHCPSRHAASTALGARNARPGRPDLRPELQVQRLLPQDVKLPSSFPLALLPVLAQGAQRSKPESGYWLTQDGWAAYLRGATPGAAQLVASSELWKLDLRIGIGMSAATGSVEKGKLFSTQAVALARGVGFLAAVRGAVPPAAGLLRLGGDGRAAVIEALAAADVQLPEPDYQAIAAAGRCRVVLTNPGLFPAGWKLPGSSDDDRIHLPGGITARLACAAVPRAEILSGWDLARWRPKPAQRVAPTGSVYWLDDLQASPQALRKLAENGLWSEPCEDPQRRAEGFNRCAIAPWPAPAAR